MINSDSLNWKFWIFVLIIVFFILWLFFSGGEKEYIGMKPLHPKYKSDDYVKKNNIYDDKILDYTPKLPKKIIELEKTSCLISSSEVSYSEEYKSNVKKYSKYEMSEDNQDKVQIETNKSIGERICCEFMSKLYGKPFCSVRPNFLKNPETGHNLEIDCYNPEIKIGVEYNGIQHYVWPNYTGNTKEEFIQQIRRDKYKVETCDKNGVYLITVPYNVPHNLIPDYIKHYLPENVMKRL